MNLFKKLAEESPAGIMTEKQRLQQAFEILLETFVSDSNVRMIVQGLIGAWVKHGDNNKAKVAHDRLMQLFNGKEKVKVE